MPQLPKPRSTQRASSCAPSTSRRPTTLPLPLPLPPTTHPVTGMGRVQEGYRCVPRAVLTDGHFFLGPLLRAYVSRHDSGSSRQGAQGRPRPAQDVRLEPGVRAIWGVGAHPAIRARRPSPPHPRRLQPRPRLVRRSTASTPVRTPAELATALADHQDAKAKAKAAKREEATSKVRPSSPRPHPSPSTPLAIRPRLTNGGGLLMSGAMCIRRALPLRHRASALRPSTLRGPRLGPAPRTCVAHSFARSRCVGQDHPHRHEGKCWRGVYFDPCPRAVPGCVSAHHGCRRSLFGGLGQRPGTPACHGAGGAVRTRPGHPACVLHTVRPAPRDHSHRSRAGLTVRHMNGAARTLQRGWWFLCCRCRWQLVAAPPTPSSITRPRYAREHRWGGGVGPRPQSALKPDRPYRDASSVADRRRRANSQRASKVTVMSPPEVRMHSGRRTDASSTVVLVLTMHVNAASLHAERTKRRLGHCVGRTWSRKRAHRAGCAPFDRIVLTRAYAGVAQRPSPQLLAASCAHAGQRTQSCKCTSARAPTAVGHRRALVVYSLRGNRAVWACTHH